MEVLLSFVVGALYAAGIYMLLRRSVVKLIIGLALLGHGANLLILTVGRLHRGAPAIVPEGASSITGDYPDPVPQALILTAIVISFAVQAFALVLIKRTYQTVGTDDLNRLRSTDRLEDPE